MEEESFPRGGRKVDKTTKIKRKPDDCLFPIEKQPKVKKQRKEKKVVARNASEDTFQSSLQLHGTLTYKKIQEEMVILSCVRYVSNLMVQIEFPGLTYGQVAINSISDAFLRTVKEKLENSDDDSCSALKNLMRVGQLLPAKIQSIQNTEKGNHVQATINPKEINEGRVHSSFKKGMLIWASIQSEMDHGYEIDLGVKNCRAFLPHKNIDDQKSYSVGEPLFCVIHKAEGSNVATTLTVSARKEHLNKVQLGQLDTLSNLMPGTKVAFLVEEIKQSGVQGKFLDTYTGYLDKTQFVSYKKFESTKVGKILEAYVLYLEPLTKVTYLTLKQIDILPPPLHPVGSVLTAKVLQIVAKGLYLSLGKNQTGFVANKRLVNGLGKSPDLSEQIRKKYPIGSDNHCRVLDYNRMDQLYICTFEQKLVSEGLFLISDLKLGQSVDVKVAKIIPNGLLVNAGHLRGFVPNLHLSNVKFSPKIKGKFTEGQKLKARVLSTSEENVIFTLKPGLIEANNCLTTNEEAVINRQFTGFVAHTNESGALVAFYGTAKGWITHKELNLDNDLGRHCDPQEYFFRGQVVNVWSLGPKKGRLQLSLNPPQKNLRDSIKIGFKLSGIVTDIKKDGISLEVGPKKINTFIPVNHLSNTLELCSSLLKTYKVGDCLGDLLCIKAGDYPVLSIREYSALQKDLLKVACFKDLKKGTILRCSFEKKTNSGIYVSFPIKDFTGNFFVENDNVFTKKGTRPKFQFQQCILARILAVDYNEKTVKLGARPDQVCGLKKIEYCVSLFSQFVQDQDRLFNFGASNNWDLTAYPLGTRVDCTIETLSPNCTVVLPNGIKGNVAENLTISKLKIGQKLEGVVIFIDFQQNSVDISLKNNQKISKKQDGIIKKSLFSSCMTTVLLKKTNCVIGVLNEKVCNRQFVYLPVQFNENESITPAVYEKRKLKVVLCRKSNNKLIGMSKRLVNNLDRKYLKPTDEHDAEENDNTENEEKSEEETEVQNGSEVEQENSENEKSEETIYSELESDVIMKSRPVLSGISNFFTVKEENAQESSSSDEESEDKVPVKKRKLTPAERAEQARLEEERLLKIEKELADAEFEPQSAEHFDRLLLANPNSSQLWIKYIAMHISNMELDKARAVGRRALDTICMTEINEKFNVWVCLLNLENMYGTEEQFERLFDEAVKFNDSFEVYLTVIRLLATCGKYREMEEKIKRIKAKEKQNLKMWLEIGKVYYTIGKFKEARNFKEAALRNVTEKKKQFDLIVRFGIMEFQFGEFEMAIANFETILEAFPAKINVWLIYVDQLVKNQKFDLARAVLERAVSQKLCVRSMKTLFQKFVRFEEEHGVKENVEKIKEQAKEYVNNLNL